MYERAPQISIGSRICDSCRKKLSKEPPYLNPEPDSPGSETEEPGLYVQAVASLNKCLADIGALLLKPVGRSTLDKKLKGSPKQ